MNFEVEVVTARVHIAAGTAMIFRGCAARRAVGL
jgi:hypothetical protein